MQAPPLCSERSAVLIVDDIEANLIALESVLANMECDVVRARSGNEALARLSERAFAVMLLDVQMPEMDGYEVARRARQHPGGRELPIIFLTATHETEAKVLRGYGSGAVDFLFKPINAVVLRGKLRTFLDLHAGRRQVENARAELERANGELRELARAKAELAERFRAANEQLESAYRELKDTQAQLVQSAKMASLGQLVAGVAHEINNPLAFVLGHLDTVRRSLARVDAELGELSTDARDDWGRAQDRLREMSLGLERIRDLVVKLRTFSRIDGGERKPVNLRESVDAVLTILKPRLRDGVELEVHVDAPEVLDCFPGPLNQALMNLTANALDAVGPQGHVAIRSDVVDGCCEISVTDDGPGIPEALRERVFEPFFTTKPVGEGTGLGLSITYAIAKKHGGSLALLDAPGSGTRAVLRIPLDPEAASAT